MQRAPVEIGKAEVEVAQAATDADVGNAVAVGAAPVALAEVVREGGQAADNLVVLAVDPVGALQCRRAALFDHDIGGGIADAIGQRLPAAGFDQLATFLREQPCYRGNAVQILDDDAGIKQRAAVVQQQDRHLAQRVEFGDVAAGLPGHVQFQRAVDLFLGQHHAHLAGKRAGQ
ncbi:hypothetical protein D3C85_1408250 [compost metagenome]